MVPRATSDWPTAADGTWLDGSVKVGWVLAMPFMPTAASWLAEPQAAVSIARQQLAQRQKELEAAEQKRLAFETANPALAKGGTSPIQRIEALRAELRGIDADLAAAQSALAAINGQLAGTPKTLQGTFDTAAVLNLVSRRRTDFQANFNN